MKKTKFYLKRDKSVLSLKKEIKACSNFSFCIEERTLFKIDLLPIYLTFAGLSISALTIATIINN